MQKEKISHSDFVVFAPHPDDAELFCGGTIAKLIHLSHTVSIVDLSEGELSTQGDTKQRAAESKLAGRILKITSRHNLKLKDGHINQHDVRQIFKCVEIIRQLKPKVVAIPYPEERHPDHVETSLLLKRAIFLAALPKFKTKGNAHTVTETLYYPMRVTGDASFVVDTSSFNETKHQAINAFKSQIMRAAKSSTLVSSELNLSSILSRDGFYGSKIGTKFGEPFIVAHPLSVSDPIEFFTLEKPLFYDQL